MSRLDKEYDRAEHHELARIETEQTEISSPARFGWVCSCGEISRHMFYKSHQNARAAHNRHRDLKAAER